jgi:hypothetical protein
MRKRRLIASAGIALLLVGLLISWALWTRWCRPTGSTPIDSVPTGIAEYERLRLGMTPAEVVAAIGMPPGYYDTTRPQLPPSMSPLGDFVRSTGLPTESLPDAAGRPAPDHPEKITLRMWTWSEYWIWVAFDVREKVVCYYLLKVTIDPFRGYFHH